MYYQSPDVLSRKVHTLFFALFYYLTNCTPAFFALVISRDFQADRRYIAADIPRRENEVQDCFGAICLIPVCQQGGQQALCGDLLGVLDSISKDKENKTINKVN